MLIFLLFYFSFCSSWNNPFFYEDICCFSTVTVNNIGILLGGKFKNNSYSNKVFIYNSISNLWNTTTIPQSLCCFENIIYNNIVIFFNGKYNNGSYSNEIYIYDTLSNLWIFYNLSIIEFQSQIIYNVAIFAGGKFINGDNSNQINIYIFSNNDWYIETLSRNYGNFSILTLNDNIVIFAGGQYKNGSYSNEISIYNIITNSWNYTIFSQSLCCFETIVINSIGIFANGQFNNGNYSDIIYIYNSSSNSWSSMKISIIKFQMININNLIIFVGGQYKNGSYSNEISIYNIITNSWNYTIFSQSLCCFETIIINGIGIFANGQFNNGNYSDIIYIYNSSSNSWSSMKISIIKFQMININNLIIFAGGQYKNGSYSNMLYIYNINSTIWNFIKITENYFNFSVLIMKQMIFFINCQFNNGSYSKIDALTICNEGMYISNESYPVCTPCLKGTYKNNISISLNSLTSCSLCSSGTFSNQTNSSSCYLCPKGTYSNITGSNSSFNCYSCPKGTSSYEGSINCFLVNSNSSLKIYQIVIPITLFFLITISLTIFFIIYKKKKFNKFKNIEINGWEVIKNVKIKKRLGGGNFGEVYKGIWNETTKVALKKLKSKEDLEEFIQEASLLQALKHPNIVQFFGIFYSLYDEKYIVMEYLSKGSLDQVLITEKDLLKINDLITFSKHAAAGMEYLEENKIIHRDLALRNLLVAPGNKVNEKYIIKISDFGLSRIMEKDYYKTDSQSIPVRWSAPEVLEQGIYSSKSDVWSFGIVLWEIFTYGKRPYNILSNVEVYKLVLSGYRLQKPENCPNEIYELMLQCWNKNPQERLNFKGMCDIITRIEKNFKEKNILENKNKNNIIKINNSMEIYNYSDNV